MKIYHRLLCATMLALSVAGCSSEHSEDIPEPEVRKIPITLNCGITATSTRATDTGFETGDHIGLYVVNYENGTAGPLLTNGNHVDNMRFTYDGAWTPDTPIYWKDETTPADFYGYYPYSSSPADVKALPVKTLTDQSTETNYKASDFLWGKTLKVSPTEKAVGITLNHLFSCAVVKVSAGNGFTTEGIEAADVRVRLNQAVCQATVNLQDGSVSPGTQKESVSFLRGKNNEFKALIIPQNIAMTDNLFTITIDGREFNLKKEFSFVGGKRHTFTITVKKTSNGINVDIGDWTDDGEDHGGVAE